MKQSSPYISLVIAALNEAENIEELTLRIDKVMKKEQLPYELIYIIAGTDGTLQKVQQLQQSMPTIKYEYSQEPSGLGHDFKKGFSMVSPQSSYVITMDADLNHHPEEIPLFLNAVRKNNIDMVIGSRGVEGSKTLNIPKWKRAISALANTVFENITNIPVKDKTSGYRLYKRQVLMDILPHIQCKNFEFLMEILLIAAKKKYHMAEVPITFTYRVHGKSKMNLLKTALGYIKLMMKHLRA